MGEMRSPVFVQTSKSVQRGGGDARDGNVGAGHDDLLTGLDVPQQLGEARLGLGKIDDVHEP